MPLELVRNDITKMQVDAIVNAANETLLGGGGVDGAIHRAAGEGLLEECRTLGGCKAGQAKITGGYLLPAKYVIHTVGPVWRGGLLGEKRLLASCYRSCLELARANHCESIAFPLISSGVYGYPKDKAIRVAMDTISDFLMEQDMRVYLVIYDQPAFLLSQKLFRDIQSFIDDNYVQQHREEDRRLQQRMAQADFCEIPRPSPTAFAAPLASAPKSSAPRASAPEASRTLEEMLRMLDESFSQMLLRKINEKGMTDTQCYKKANIDRKLFSKIRSDPLYKPSKPTVLAFAVALELPLSETRDLLQKAGFALSRSNKFDVIVEYCIRSGIYDIYQINEALFAFDQNLLGCG